MSDNVTGHVSGLSESSSPFADGALYPDEPDYVSIRAYMRRLYGPIWQRVLAIRERLRTDPARSQITDDDCAGLECDPNLVRELINSDAQPVEWSDENVIYVIFVRGSPRMYVGKAKDAIRRLYQHISAAKRYCSQRSAGDPLRFQKGEILLYQLLSRTALDDIVMMPIQCVVDEGGDSSIKEMLTAAEQKWVEQLRTHRSYKLGGLNTLWPVARGRRRVARAAAGAAHAHRMAVISGERQRQRDAKLAVRAAAQQRQRIKELAFAQQRQRNAEFVAAQQRQRDAKLAAQQQRQRIKELAFAQQRQRNAERQRIKELAFAQQRQRNAEFVAAQQRQRDAKLAAMQQRQRNMELADEQQRQRDAELVAAQQRQRNMELADEQQRQRDAELVAAQQRQRDAELAVRAAAQQRQRSKELADEQQRQFDAELSKQLLQRSVELTVEQQCQLSATVRNERRRQELTAEQQRQRWAAVRNERRRQRIPELTAEQQRQQVAPDVARAKLIVVGGHLQLQVKFANLPATATCPFMYGCGMLVVSSQGCHFVSWPQSCDIGFRCNTSRYTLNELAYYCRSHRSGLAHKASTHTASSHDDSELFRALASIRSAVRISAWQVVHLWLAPATRPAKDVNVCTGWRADAAVVSHLKLERPVGVDEGDGTLSVHPCHALCVAEDSADSLAPITLWPCGSQGCLPDESRRRPKP